MNAKQIKALESFLQKQFPNGGIHVTADAKMEYRIWTNNIDDPMPIKCAVEEFLGPQEWGNTHYGSE